MSQKYETPDIIEDVPVCSEDLTRTKRYEKSEEGRVVFQIPDDNERQNRWENLELILNPNNNKDVIQTLQ